MKRPRFFVTGSHGLIGKALCQALSARGDEVIPLLRPPQGPPTWDPHTGALQGVSLSSEDGVIHLAGESVFAHRWSAEVKRHLRESRVEATSHLCSTLASLPSPPKVLLSASATGYYGDRGEVCLDEASPVGTDFLPQLAREWEEATQTASTAGIRVILPRFGIVLSREEGALAHLLPFAQWGLGGPIGGGRQYWSWITLEDAVRALLFLLDHAFCKGPYNLTSPFPLTQRTFMQTLGHTLKRPSFLPLPAWAAKLLLGERASALLLMSTRAVPKRLLEAGFVFSSLTLENALSSIL